MQPISPPDHVYVGRCPGRCPECAAVVIPRSLREGRRVFACAFCGLMVSPGFVVRCPDCGARARFEAGALTCPANCPPVPTAHHEPAAAWEACHTEAAARETPEAWGLRGVGSWDRYARSGLLAEEWGAPGPLVEERDRNGVFLGMWAAPGHLGRRDEDLDAERSDNEGRCDEMKAALDDFAKAIRRSPPLPKAGPRWYRFLAARVWTLLREVLGDLVAVLVNAVLRRGSTYSDFGEIVRFRQVRATPYGSYRGAIAPALGVVNPEATSRGGSSPLAAIASVPYKHRLPSGVVFGRIAVHPTPPSPAFARSDRPTGHLDATACAETARVGGQWIPVRLKADGTVERPAICTGGRPLTPLERYLLELCDVGVSEAGDWVRLKPTEALRRAQHLRRGGAWVFPEARRLLLGEAPALVARARAAAAEALEAWGLIPRIPPKPRKAKDSRDVTASPPAPLRPSFASENHL